MHYILNLYKTYAHVSILHTLFEVFPSIDYLSGKEVPIIERNMPGTRGWSPGQCT